MDGVPHLQGGLGLKRYTVAKENEFGPVGLTPKHSSAARVFILLVFDHH